MKWPTCDKVDKVPGVVMEYGLEVLDELLDHRLHHHTVVVTALHTDHHLVGNEILIKKWRKNKSSFEFWSTHWSFTITTKVPDETSLKEKPHLMKWLKIYPIWRGKCYWLLDTTIVHLVWKIEEGGLQNHHEDDPLIKRGLWGLGRTLTIITIRYYVMVICNIYTRTIILTEWYFVSKIWEA